MTIVLKEGNNDTGFMENRVIPGSSSEMRLPN